MANSSPLWMAIGKRPSSMGSRVVDAWPAMSLRLWCRDDMYYTGQALRDLFGPSPDKSRKAYEKTEK